VVIISVNTCGSHQWIVAVYYLSRLSFFSFYILNQINIVLINSFILLVLKLKKTIIDFEKPVDYTGLKKMKEYS